MAPRVQTSASGVLALLSDPDPQLQQYALAQLNALVPQFWAEISESVTAIETLYENEALPKNARGFAGLVASKVYYYLAEYDEALSFALGAGPSFEQERSNSGAEEYVETVVSKAIDRYIQATEETGKSQGKIDPRLVNIIEGIFNKCLEDGEYKQVHNVFLEVDPYRDPHLRCCLM
jgi:26S proteasome regulatory subunit N2